MISHPRLKIRDLRVRAVNVPMRLPLQTSGGTVGIAPLALIDLLTEEGVTGRTYLFCYTPLALQPVVQMLENLAPLLKGDPVAPLEIERKLQRQFRLLGAKGVVGMALAGIDMAAWDALARAQGMPLARLLGGAPRAIPGLQQQRAGHHRRRARRRGGGAAGADGFRAIKVRLGYADAKADVEVVRAVRRAIGEGVALMSDYNQALSVAEAMHAHRGRWPARAWTGSRSRRSPTTIAGHAQIRAQDADCASRWARTGGGRTTWRRCLAAGGSDLGMPDAMKIGGVTGWLRAAALAESAGLPVSSHLFPEVSAHLLAVVARPATGSSTSTGRTRSCRSRCGSRTGRR